MREVPDEHVVQFKLDLKERVMSNHKYKQALRKVKRFQPSSSNLYHTMSTDSTATGVLATASNKEIVGYFVIGNGMVQLKMTASATGTDAVPLFVANATLSYRSENDLTETRNFDVNLGTKDITSKFDNGPSVKAEVMSGFITKQIKLSGTAEWSKL
ncbi:hypothetical protein ACEPAF_1652 [Sanghuangporus sanghuang]